jgi:hypothetical protein
MASTLTPADRSGLHARHVRSLDHLAIVTSRPSSGGRSPSLAPLLACPNRAARPRLDEGHELAPEARVAVAAFASRRGPPC